MRSGGKHKLRTYPYCELLNNREDLFGGREMGILVLTSTAIQLSQKIIGLDRLGKSEVGSNSEGVIEVLEVSRKAISFETSFNTESFCSQVPAIGYTSAVP